MAALAAGNADVAEREFVEGRRRAKQADPFDLALTYVAIARGDREIAHRSLQRLVAVADPAPAAIEALADLDAADGRWREAFAGYRRLGRLLPGDPRAVERLGAARSALEASLRAEAARALSRSDLDLARRSALGLLELEPGSPDGYLILARAAAAGGNLEDAWTAARKAATLSPPADREAALLLAEFSARTGRFAEAAELYDGLAGGDPALRAKADAARLDFRIRNLPDAARRAAQSPRLTRAQLAVLLWWTLPEVREAPAAGRPDVASDVVDHPERRALARAISLGFLPVSPDTHRVGAGTTVGKSELASALRRAFLLACPRRRLPDCLAPERPSLSALASCGILPESAGKAVTGREALGALERDLRPCREGVHR